MTDTKRLRLIANEIRQDIVRMTAEAKSGHPGGALGMAEVFAALYFEIMQHDPNNAKDENRDYLFLSNGHICPVLYGSLARAGYFPVDELLTFRKIDSRLQGHPHNTSLPGVENSGGPLGQGISQAVGAARALKQDNKANRVFCVCGDGELNEGQVWEAALFAGHYKLDNLVQIIDRNHIQIDGNTDQVMQLEPLRQKFESFQYHVLDMDANNIHNILEVLQQAIQHQGSPVCILAHTTPGKHVSFMENDHHWHGKAPNEEQKNQALHELEEHRRRIEEEA